MNKYSKGAQGLSV